MEEKGCDTCKFKEEDLETGEGSRCDNCLHLTRKGRSYFPSWEREDEDEQELILHYI